MGAGLIKQPCQLHCNNVNRACAAVGKLQMIGWRVSIAAYAAPRACRGVMRAQTY
jgi:hypothetical protein